MRFVISLDVNKQDIYIVLSRVPYLLFQVEDKPLQKIPLLKLKAVSMVWPHN